MCGGERPHPMVAEAFEVGQETVVLCSGGLDSAVLLAHEAQTRKVQPIYVSTGLAWEHVEYQWMLRFLDSLGPKIQPSVKLLFDMRDVYPETHWAIQGQPPGYDTPDEDVYIIGRNIVLLTKVALFCAQNGFHRIAVGPLAGNPFPDATPDFFKTFEHSLSLGLNHRLTITAPFTKLQKADVIQLGLELSVPLRLTLSCMNPPQENLHCGECSKCRERQQGFHEAAVSDPTDYIVAPPSSYSFLNKSE